MLAPAASSEVVVGKHRVLAVLISFGPRPFPRAGVTAALDEAAAFIHRSSFARLTLQTTTTPWLAGGTPPPSCDAPPESMFGPLRAIATAGGFPTSRYDRILYVVAGPDRGFHGIEFGNEVLVVREPDARLIIHELGHTFGLLHAGASTVCGRWCVTQEQGDLYSPMGSGVTDFSAYEKEQLGWIPRQPRVARRGRYLVYPSSRSIGRQALVVDAPEGEYWLEQRPGRATPGLIVRIVDQVTSSRAFIAPSTLLLAPIRTGHPVITPGQTFRVEGEFTVTVARTSAAPLRLNLTLAGGTSQPPTVLAAAVAALALAAPTVPQGNLLKNPGAEAGQSSQSGETTVPIPGWQTTSTFTVAPYGGGGCARLLHVPAAERESAHRRRQELLRGRLSGRNEHRHADCRHHARRRGRRRRPGHGDTRRVARWIPQSAGSRHGRR